MRLNEEKLDILFIHQNFPGQYVHLAPLLADLGHNIFAVSINKQPHIRGVKPIYYTPQRSTSSQIHPWVMDFETKVIRGEACALKLLELYRTGFYPHIIMCHPGWGEGMYLREIFPKSKILFYFEFYYNSTGFDVGFDPEFPSEEVDRFRIVTKNPHNLISLLICDHGVTPTYFQLSSFPKEFHNKISVIFDGIDTDVVKPNENAYITFSNGVTLTREHIIITFVNRNLEPYRGWHTFARAIPYIQKRLPDAIILIVGGDDVSYGSRPKDGISYKQRYINEVKDKVDWGRVFFLGRIPYNIFLKVLQISSAHVYLTYPFVLSWSMLEAMSCGCIVIGSRTPPVEEVIIDGVNGFLVDFFSPEELAEKVEFVVKENKKLKPIKEQARETIIKKYDLKRVCIPQHLELINGLLES